MTKRASGAATTVAPARSRHGQHASPRVEFHAPASEIARWRADAEREGLTLTDWLREAARAYERMGPHGELTDEDWRYVVSG
jgi:hypothetical protein